MSTEKKLATSGQAKELLDEVMKLTDRKGHTYSRDPKTYWRGDTVSLPAALRKRAEVNETDARNFHVAAELAGATALKELAIVTFTCLGEPVGGKKVLRYRVMPLSGLQDLSLECVALDSIFPGMPSEGELRDLEIEMGVGDDDLRNVSSGTLNNPDDFGRELLDSANVNMFRYEMLIEAREAKARSLGEFTASSDEAVEVITLVRGFADA